MGLLGTLIVFAVSTALQFLLRPRIKRGPVPDLEFPRAEEGIPVPVVYGTQAVSPIITGVGAVEKVDVGDGVIHYQSLVTGDLCVGEITEIVDVQFGGKSLRLHPVTRDDSTSETETRHAIVVDGAPTVPGLPYTFTEASDSVLFDVNAKLLFGGDESEGGVERHIRIYRGTSAQPVDEVTAFLWAEAGLDGTGSGYPSVAYIVFGSIVDGEPLHFYWGNVPQPKSPVVLVKVIPSGLGFGAIGNDANPAEIIYDLLTHPVRGKGIRPDLIDADSFLTCAARLQAEGLGLSCTFSQQQELQDQIDDIGRHIHGDCYQSALTGKWTMVLARDDYELEDLDEVSRATARDLVVTRPSWRPTLNEVKVNFREYDDTPLTGAAVVGEVLTDNLQLYGVGFPTPYQFLASLRVAGRNITNVTVHNVTQEIDLTAGVHYRLNASAGLFLFGADALLPITGEIEVGDTITVDYTNGSELVGYKDKTEIAQNLAHYQATGGDLQSDTIERPFFTTALNASIHAWRELKLRGRPLATAQWTETRVGYARKPGDVVAVTWTPEGAGATDFSLTTVPFRVTQVDYGTLEDGGIRVQAIEDVFGATVIPTLPDGPSTPPGVRTAPGMVIACGSGDTVVRIALFASDPLFSIELWRADDEAGTNAVLVDTVAGTTTFYDDASGTGKSHQARMVRAGYEDGAFTPWITCDPSGCDPEEPVCVLPSALAETFVTETTGTLVLTVTDTQTRVSLVEFRLREGAGEFGAWIAAVDSEGVITSAVALVEDETSRIEWAVTYQACDGTTAELSGGADFTGATESEEPPVTGITEVPVKITLLGSTLPRRYADVPEDATALDPFNASQTKFPLGPFRSARVVVVVTETSLPVGAVVAAQFEHPEEPDTWVGLDGGTGPSLAVDSASVTDLGKAMSGEWIALADEARVDVRLRGVLMGGDDDRAKVIGLARVDLDLVAVDMTETHPPLTDDPAPEDPGSCDIPTGVFTYADQAAAFTAWPEG